MTKVSLWFSEDISPGLASSITIKLGGTSVAMGVTSSNVTIAGSAMDLSIFPGKLNSAGSWNVLVPAGSLKDSLGNHFTGVNDTGSFPSFYKFSVVASDATKPTLTTADILPATETSPTYTLGTSDSVKLVFSETVQASTGAVSFKASYTSPTVVAPTANEVFMVGGKNGTAGSSALLNDVWKLATNRAINCASSYGAKTACSATTCTDGALGTSTAVSTIWKAPSASGLKCMSTSGVAITMLGQTVDTRTEDCPCPTCATAPDGSLVANILDGGSYLSTGYTPVSVGGTLELKCGLGYTSNGSSFSCIYSSPYAGIYATPYPTCDP